MKYVRHVALAGWVAAHGALGGLAAETDARADAPDRVLVVYVEAGSDVDPSEVRGAVAAELGVRVPEPGDPTPAGAGLLHVRSQSGLLRVTYRDSRGRTMEREIAAPGEARSRAKMIALLAGNLARNEADELVGVEPPAGSDEPAPAPEPAPKPAANVATPSADVAKPLAAPVPARAPAQDAGSGQRTLGWVGIGAGVVSAGIGAGLLVSAKSEMDSLSASCAPYCAQSQVADGRTKTIAGDVFVVSGVLLGAGGTLLVVTAPSGGSPTHEAPSSESWQRTAGWIALGTGVAGVGVGAVLRVMAAYQQEKAVPSGCTPSNVCYSSASALAAADDASTKTVQSNWAFALGGLAAATGVVLELTAPNASSGTTVAVGPTGIRVGGTW